MNRIAVSSKPLVPPEATLAAIFAKPKVSAMATARPPRIRIPKVAYAFRACAAAQRTPLNARSQKTRERPRVGDATGCLRSELSIDDSHLQVAGRKCDPGACRLE